MNSSPAKRVRPLQVIHVVEEEDVQNQAARLQQLNACSPVLLREAKAFLNRRLPALTAERGRAQAKRVMEMLGGVGLLMLVAGWLRQWVLSA